MLAQNAEALIGTHLKVLRWSNAASVLPTGVQFAAAIRSTPKRLQREQIAYSRDASELCRHGALEPYATLETAFATHRTAVGIFENGNPRGYPCEA